MRRLIEYLIVAILALALGACSALDAHWWPPQEQMDVEPLPAAESPDTPPQDGSAGGDLVVIVDHSDDLLNQVNGYLAQPREAQRQEFTRREAMYLDSPSDLNLIHHALLAALTHPERPGAYARIRGDLAAWMSKQQAAATDEEQDLVPLARVVLHLLDERERLMAQLTSQNEELQRKLDELKAIEQQLRERDSTEIIRTLP